MWRAQVSTVRSAIKHRVHPDEIVGRIRNAREAAKDRFVRHACKTRKFESELCADVVTRNMQNSLLWGRDCKDNRRSEWFDMDGKAHPCAKNKR